MTLQPETEATQQKPKNKGGRPKGSTKLQLTDELVRQIEGLARIQCTQREAGAVLGVDEDTFRSFLGLHKKALEAWENGKEVGKASLRRHQFRMAETNATMQVWLGKQWLGQKDQMQLGGDPDNPIRMNVTRVELIAPQRNDSKD